MKSDARTEYVTRDSILKLLSDDEVAKVSTAETADHLIAGDEYLDLEKLEQGVQRAGGKATPMGRVLPRKAVHEKTWDNRHAVGEALVSRSLEFRKRMYPVTLISCKNRRRCQAYRSFGGPLVATKVSARTGHRVQTFTSTSASYEPLADSIFDLPDAVKALLK